MTEVVSVRFKNKGKVYFFSPNGITVEKGDHVIVETAKGLEYAECVSGNHTVDDAAVRLPLRPVVRLSTKEDDCRNEENRAKEAEAFEIWRQKIEKHGLDMKLVDVEYNFEGNKVLFFYTAEGRVDFRELVKDLAGVFKMRVELRQIGVRDEARMLGGMGICGKPFCCAQFLDDFQPVSIKMAKTQGLSLNPTKISGTCGRLMCCLKYEQDAYEDLVKNVPKVDAFVETPSGKGSVMDVNLLKGTVRVRLEDQNELAIHTFRADEVEVLGGKAKRAEYLAARAENKQPEQPRNATNVRKPFAPANARQERPGVRTEEQSGEERPRQFNPNIRRPAENPEERRPVQSTENAQKPQSRENENAHDENQAAADGQALKKQGNRRRRHHRGRRSGGNASADQGE